MHIHTLHVHTHTLHVHTHSLQYTHCIVLYCMSFLIQLSQALPDKLQESTETKAYIKKNLSKNKTKMHEFAPHCYALGKLAMYTLNDEEKLIATSHGFTDTENVMIFHRLMLHNTIYSSEQYRRKGMKRNNSICCFCSSSGELWILSNYGFLYAEQFSSLQYYQTISTIR